MASVANAAPVLRDVSLDDKYALESGRVFLTGAQAFVRLLILQRQRDVLAGLNTAGFVSGYRGSPLGALDQSLWKASKFLERAHIKFQPGLNEDLAATSLWGTQQVNLYPGALYDGVFAMWYGKGPGVDRCGDVFKHANHAGHVEARRRARAGGRRSWRQVVDPAAPVGPSVLGGDDAGAVPVVGPGDPRSRPSRLGDVAILGSAGSASSASPTRSRARLRSASIPSASKIVIPDDFPLPPDGLSIRWPDGFLETEARMQNYKVYAALHYCRVNKLNKIVIDSPKPRLGIITSGKSYLDVRQALDDLGITEADAAEIGIRVYKIAMTWPLEPEGVRHFAEGLEEILVVEEKRQVVEYQLKEQLYNWRDDVRPRVVGKFDEKGEWVRPHGDWLLPALSELTPAMIARVIAQRIERLGLHPRQAEKLKARVDWINAKEAALAKPRITLERLPWFCSGCPHNTSTNVPEGSRATAGIGCHVMAIWMDRRTRHVHAHGRRRRALDRPGAVHDGKAHLREPGRRHLLPQRHPRDPRRGRRPSVEHHLQDPLQRCGRDDRRPAVRRPAHAGDIARQVAAEGVKKIIVVSDEPDKYPSGYFDAGIRDPSSRRSRRRAARRCATPPGCTILLYDQTCAAEKRRRRKRGKYPDPAKRVVHQRARLRRLRRLRRQVQLRVGRAGRDRVRPQAHDRPELVQQGLFVRQRLLPELRHRRGRRPAQAEEGRRPATSPHCRIQRCRRRAEPYGIVVTGIGGTGVVTIGALLGMAAHLEGKGCSVLDMTGPRAEERRRRLARAHRRHRRRRSTRRASPPAKPKLILACDILTGVGYEQLAKMQKGVTKALVNTALVMPAGFTRDPDLVFPRGSMEREIEDAVAPGDAEFLDATKLATGLMGDSIATNLFMVGYAFQRGLLPVSEGGDPARDRTERRGGRVEQAELPLGPPRRDRSRARVGGSNSIGQARVAAAVGIARRNDRATRQVPHRLPGRGYAKRYTDFVAKVRAAESTQGPGQDRAGGGRRALLLQAARGEGRVRSRASLCRRRFREARRRRSSTATTSSGFISRLRCSTSRTAVTGEAEEEHLRAVDDERVSGAGEDARIARARRSTRSAARPSGGWSARCRRSTKR